MATTGPNNQTQSVADRNTLNFQWGKSGGSGGPGPGTPASGSIATGGGGNTSVDLQNADTAAVGVDAQALIGAVLSDYGLQSLASWAWQEITSGASSAQVLTDMYQTPQFKARFPAIGLRNQAGLPPISPADYVNYEDTLQQYESQYGLPQGALSNKDTVTQFIAGDVSTSEVQARVQQGFQAVAYAAPEVRQAFTSMFGASGDGALAHYFLDPTKALPLLEQQATAAQIGGTTAMGGVNVDTDTAMRLAAMGVTQSQASSAVQQLDKTSPLFNATVTEKDNLSASRQGIEAAFGLNPTAEQQIQQRQESREAAFAGGGSAYGDTHGLEGAGTAHPF